MSAGVFETIRYRWGMSEFLEEHLARLQQGCDALHFPFPDTNVRQDISAAVDAHGLANNTCRVRLFITADGLSITVESYEPLSQKKYSDGIRLITEPHPDPTQGARIKRIDRKGYQEALKRAQAKGYDECLFADRGGILECSTANVIVSDRGKYLVPKVGSSRLHGVMEQAVLNALTTPTQESELTLPLPKTAKLYITSSMRGIVPVREIGGTTLAIDRDDPLFLLIPRFWPYS